MAAPIEAAHCVLTRYCCGGELFFSLEPEPPVPEDFPLPANLLS
jgi:hypothetical protein